MPGRASETSAPNEVRGVMLELSSPPILSSNDGEGEWAPRAGNYAEPLGNTHMLK